MAAIGGGNELRNSRKLTSCHQHKDIPATLGHLTTGSVHNAEVPPIERRKVYDTTHSGRSNAGHTYGDELTDAERRAVIEYLKTL